MQQVCYKSSLNWNEQERPSQTKFFLGLHEILLFLNENRKKRRIFPFYLQPFRLDFIPRFSLRFSVSIFFLFLFNFITKVRDDILYRHKRHTLKEMFLEIPQVQSTNNIFMSFSVQFHFLSFSFHFTRSTHWNYLEKLFIILVTFLLFLSFHIRNKSLIAILSD